MPVVRGSAASRVVASMHGVLQDLSERVRRDDVDQDGPDAGYVDLIDVVGDLGRALAAPDVPLLRGLLPEIASVREALEDPNDRQFGPVARTPRQALQDPKLGTAYAAGALWACSAIAMGFIDAATTLQRRRAERVTREDVRQLVMQLANDAGAIRPVDVQKRLAGEGEEVHPTTISRALADLLESGELQAVAAPPGADRRARYYSATDVAGSEATKARLELRAVLERISDRLTRDALATVVDEETSHALAG